jgi:4-hydroxy-tetrahydrodipicolinate synthase
MGLTAADLHGVIPAIVTPFTEDGERLDEAALRAITRYVLDGGVHAIMTTGGTGEFPHLTAEERTAVTRIVVDEVAGRVPVIAGTAACSTREVLLLSEAAARVGAAAVIVTAPYYFRLPLSALYQHYVTIARRSPLPVVVYNNPLYTGNDLPPSLIIDLAQVEGIIGLKQSNPDLGLLVEIVRQVGDRFSVLTGIDSQFYPSLCVGARGIFSTAACVVPRQMVELYALTRAERHAEARTLHLRLQALNRFLEYDPGYVAPCKEALAMIGLPAGPVRAPLPSLTPAEREALRQALAELGLLPAPAV